MNLSRMLRRVAQPVAGQSLVFSAILFFVLIGFAALAIDTGEAFSRQREQQAASTAASIGGLEALGLSSDDGAVLKAVKAALIANGIDDPQDMPAGVELDPNKNYFRAIYTQRGSRTEARVGGLGGVGATVPPEFNGVLVEVRSARSTIFAQALGVETLEVSAQNKATWCQCATYIFPMAVSADKMVGMLPNTDVTFTWRKDKLTNVADEKNHFVWAEWRTLAGYTPDNRLKLSLGGTGDVITGVTEATPPAGYTNPSNNGVINNDDWIKVSDSVLLPGDSTIAPLLNALKTGKMILLPTFSKLSYARVGTQDLYTSFRSGGFVNVKLKSFTNTTITLTYVNAKSTCPCVDVPLPPPPADVKVTLDQKLVWYLPSVNTTSYDISLVVDISGSMKWCWNNQNSCSVAANSRWYLVKEFLKKFSYKMLDVWNAPAGTPMNNSTLFPGEELLGKGGDNRIAAVRFSNNAYTASPSFGFVNSPLGGDQASVTARTTATRTKMNTLINWISASTMDGSTSGGQGLREGIRYFDQVSAHTRNDRFGRPIKLVILMLTDGLTNVMYDGDQQADQNTHKLPHTNANNNSVKYCKAPNDPTFNDSTTIGRDGYPVTDLPEVQAKCPWDGTSAPNGFAKAPIAALIAVSDTARNRVSPQRPISIVAILVGDQATYGLADLRIDRIASAGSAFYAKDPNTLNQALTAIVVSLTQPCYPRDALIPAASAKITVRDSTNTVVPGMSQMQASTTGTLIFTVPEPGSYSFSATREVKVWNEFPLGAGETINPTMYQYPTDPRMQNKTYLPQMYNRLKAQDDIVYRDIIPFTVPEDAEGQIDLGKYTLIISEAEAFKGLCPE